VWKSDCWRRAYTCSSVTDPWWAPLLFLIALTPGPSVPMVSALTTHSQHPDSIRLRSSLPSNPPPIYTSFKEILKFLTYSHVFRSYWILTIHALFSPVPLALYAQLDSMSEVAKIYTKNLKCLIQWWDTWSIWIFLITFEWVGEKWFHRCHLDTCRDLPGNFQQNQKEN